MPERVRIAILGDAEPKPNPVFENLERAVSLIEALHRDEPFDFIAGIGDLVHRGSIEQYEHAGPMMERLPAPFLPIMGNEERCAPESQERFLRYARAWNGSSAGVRTSLYTRSRGGVRFVFASASDRGREFTREDVARIRRALKRPPQTPTVLFIHVPPVDTFPAGPCMSSRLFNERVLTLPNLAAVFSGHTHLNLDDHVGHVQDAEAGLCHVHVPGLERTKLGQCHVPRLRVLAIEDGEAVVETWNLLDRAIEPHHRVSFSVAAVGAST